MLEDVERGGIDHEGHCTWETRENSTQMNCDAILFANFDVTTARVQPAQN